MFVSSFLTFMAIGGFPSFVEDMKVCFVSHLSINQFYAHRSTSFFKSTKNYSDEQSLPVTNKSSLIVRFYRLE